MPHIEAISVGSKKATLPKISDALVLVDVDEAARGIHKEVDLGEQ